MALLCSSCRRAWVCCTSACTARLSLDHLAHHAGQALERIRLLDHLGIAADALVEVAGLRAELAELGEHLVDQALQRVARLFPVDLDLGMAHPRMVQHVAHRAHAARGQAFLDLDAHRVALALDPAVVLGEVGEARGQLVAELAELVEQVVAVLQHPLGAQAGRLHLLGERRARAFGGEPLVEPGELGAELAVGLVAAAAPAAGRWPGSARCATQAGIAARHGRRAPRALPRPRRWRRPAARARPGRSVSAASSSAPAASLSQLLISWARRCCSRFGVAAAAGEHALDAFLAPRRGPVAAAALHAADDPLDQRRQRLAGDCWCRRIPGGRRFS